MYLEPKCSVNSSVLQQIINSAMLNHKIRHRDQKINIDCKNCINYV